MKRENIKKKIIKKIGSKRIKKDYKREQMDNRSCYYLIKVKVID